MGISSRSIGKQATGSSGEELVKELFTTYFDRLAYFAFRLLNDRELANDMAQDAFVKFWQVRSEVEDHPVAIKNFLYTTVKNSCLNSIRRQKVAGEYLSHLERESEPGGTVIEAIVTSEVLHLLDEAIEALPESYRRISTLAYLDGKKNQEIADLLDMSVNTVKKQKQRALELLRMKLTPELLALLLLLRY